MNYFSIGILRLWALGANLIVAYLVTTHLSPVDQGYYYAFQSLGAAQFFFDLGIGFVLANMAGRHMAKWGEANASNIEALSIVLRFSLKWSFLTAFLLIVTLFFVGRIMFPDEIQSAWLFYSMLVALNMVINAQLSILEGAGRVLAVSAIRALQSVFFVLVFFVFVTQNMGIQVLPWALLCSVLPVLLWLIWTLGPTFIIKHGIKESINWQRDILPFQWRMAISWVSGYFIFQAPVPFLFKAVGPESAGQLGLSMQIFQALTTLAGVLLSTRIKAWTRLAVNEKYLELRDDLWRAAFLSVGSVFVGGAILLTLHELVSQIFPLYAERVVEVRFWLLLTIAAIANQLFFNLNYYFRAQGKEPLWRVAATAGITSVLAAWFAISASLVSMEFVVIVYCIISVAIHAGGGMYIYSTDAK